jgi:DNA-directed RNA polymerase specialized sigma24 family protein
MARVSRMSYTELEEDAAQPDEAEEQPMSATGRPERKPKGSKRDAKRKIEDQSEALPEENEELVVKPLKEE